jgi:subtilisin family serine protease
MTHPDTSNRIVYNETFRANIGNDYFDRYGHGTHVAGIIGGEMAMSILFISHDLLSVASICRRVAILSEGGVVEFSSTQAIFRNPTHSYSRALIASLPTLAAGLSESAAEYAPVSV